MKEMLAVVELLEENPVLLFLKQMDTNTEKFFS